MLLQHGIEQSSKLYAGLAACPCGDIDIEFIIRRGAQLEISDSERNELIKIISIFKKRDYKVVLGSILDDETRNYYSENGFAFLLSQLNEKNKIQPQRHKGTKARRHNLL